ncbi:MAG: hypothetical protein ACFB15_13425 [Cyclobacteriaceae bacterium]
MKKKFSFFKRHILKHNYFFHRRLREVQTQKDFPRELLSELQSERFSAMVRYAYKHSRFYRRFYDEHGVNINQVQNIQDSAKLPILEKEMVRNYNKGFLTTSPYFCIEARTSGTSGSPLVVYRDWKSTVVEEAYLWRQRGIFSHKYGERAVSLRGNLDRSKFKEYDPFSKVLYLSSYLLNERSADHYYHELKQFTPKAMYAYPSSLETLANFLLDQGKSLQIPVVFTSSETLYDFQRSKIEKAFNTRVVDWYGNAERTIALEENVKGDYDELPLYSFNEYHDQYTLSTGLINFSFPLIRYKVHDIIIPGTEEGRVSKIFGRADDVITLPDGTKIGRLGMVFKNIDGLKLAQVVQDNVRELEINIVPNQHFKKEETNLLRKNMHKRIGMEMKLNIRIVNEDDIIKTEKGKYKLIVNNLNKSVLPELIPS